MIAGSHASLGAFGGKTCVAAARALVWTLACVAGSGAGENKETPVFDAAAAKHFFNARGCNACHAVDEPRLAPPFRAVAVRYRAAIEGGTGAPAAAIEEALVEKVLKGGAGAWGFVPMVSNPRLPATEARAAVRWILALEAAPR